MKIVYGSCSAIPSQSANSIHVMKMCQALAKNGSEVFLLVPNLKTALALKDENPYQYYGVDLSFQIIRLPWLPIKGRAFVYGFMAALAAKRLKADLFYGRDINSCFWASLIRMPVIYESHQPIDGSGSFYNRLFRSMLTSKSFLRLVVISEALKQHYLNHYHFDTESKVITAHDGADLPPEIETYRPESSGVLNVGYVGHLYPGKGMEVIAKLVDKCPWAHFHIVGGQAEVLNAWKERLAGRKNLTFYGHLPHSRAIEISFSLDVLIAPYQERVRTYGRGDIARWMSPLKIFEYMSTGKPIICSDLPVLREILQNGVDALLCGPEDIDCWADSLQNLKEEPELGAKLGEAARKKLSEKYTWQRRVENILNQVER